MKAVIFDLDGTLTEFNIDIDRIKGEIAEKLGIEIDRKRTILDIIEALDENKKKIALEILEKHEISSAINSKLKKEAKDVIKSLRKMGIKIGLVTRNNYKSCIIVVEKFDLKFDCIVSREFAKVKPEKDQLELAVKLLGVDKKDVVYVGDHYFDYLAGKRAGVDTFIINGKFLKSFPKNEKPKIINSLKEVVKIVRERIKEQE